MVTVELARMKSSESVYVALANLFRKYSKQAGIQKGTSEMLVQCNFVCVEFVFNQ